jgi:TonB family protein
MYILFQGEPEPSPVEGRVFWAPRLLIELPPWPEVFFGNLADLVKDLFRRPEPLELTSLPAPFWPDVFVPRRLPLASFRFSVLYHVLMVAALWGISWAHVVQSRVQVRDPFANSKLVYYPVSEYLPPLNEDSAPPRAKIAQKGEPAFARQRIVSRPRHPDNSAQTVITPPDLHIEREVPLPNIVAWTKTPAAVPVAAISATVARLAAPAPPQPIVPPPNIARTSMNAPAIATPVAVPPPPSADLTRSKMPVFTAPNPVAPPPEMAVVSNPRSSPLPVIPAVEPPPSTNGARPPGELNLARLETHVLAPHLPEPEQRAVWIKSSSARSNRTAENLPAPVLPASHSEHSIGQIVALGLHPTTPTGPVAVPQGNRRGDFAAGPEGKPDAPGIPEIPGGGKIDRSNSAPSPLEGILVAAGPVNPGPIAAAGPAALRAAMPAKPAPATTQKPFLAALKSPTELARQTRPGAGGSAPPKIEETVFGSKQYYSMMLNMPNFTSTGGSWIIRFAELKQSREPGELKGPVALVKVDPAYSPDLQQKVKDGVVVLYAVIRADGSVSDVRVLRSVDQRLDASASAALMQWRFRPGTKNGNAVALEAVIQIPFTKIHFE